MSNASRITLLAQKIASRIRDFAPRYSANMAPETYFTTVEPRTDLTPGTEYRQPNANVHWMFVGGNPQVAANWTPWTYTYARQYSFQDLLNGRAADLSALTTAVKTNLVAAINEINAKVTDSGATLLTPQPGYTGQNFGYRLINNVVYLQGIINRDAGNFALGSTQLLVVMPTGLRPAINSRFIIPVAGNSWASAVVQANGEVYITNLGAAANNAHFPEVAYPIA